MNALNTLGQSLNPLNLLQGSLGAGSPLGGADPMTMLMSFFGNPTGTQHGQRGGEVCSCGTNGSHQGAYNCGCGACQKNQSLGF